MRTLAKLVTIGVVAFVTACGGDGISDPGNSVVGTYALKTVNGVALPAVIFETDGYKIEVVAANYVLAAAGKFSTSATFRETEAGVATQSTETATGTYSVSGATITFTDSEGDVFSAVLSGNDLQFSEDGLTAVFTR